MKIKHVYKAVGPYGKKSFKSASPPHFELELIYQMNRWTKAFNGTPGIFVFTSYRQARGFLSSGFVLLCEYDGEPLPLFSRLDFRSLIFGYKSLVSIFSNPKKRERVIERINSRGFKHFSTHCPAETFVVNAVKPIKIVWPLHPEEVHRNYPLHKVDNSDLPSWMDNRWSLKRGAK